MLFTFFPHYAFYFFCILRRYQLYTFLSATVCNDLHVCVAQLMSSYFWQSRPGEAVRSLQICQGKYYWNGSSEISLVTNSTRFNFSRNTDVFSSEVVKEISKWFVFNFRSRSLLLSKTQVNVLKEML